ncbi:hypothetical protein DFJ74DRAFT_249492 [Hyaloraphidium curvatum]|nr:hypothetical protein DFJ74DRAFT_249492 [Hyaloraphidium curvatum]
MTTESEPRGKLPPPLTFSRAEWLAIIPNPAAQHGARGIRDVENRVPEVSSPLPEPGALTRAELLEGCSCSPFLAALVVHGIASVSTFARIQPFRHAALFALVLAMFAPTWIFNDGTFGQKQLVASLVAFLVGVSATVVQIFLSWKSFAAAAELCKGNDFSWHFAAGLARWSQLVGRIRRRETCI